jgi:hypothetical protein
MERRVLIHEAMSVVDLKKIISVEFSRGPSYYLHTQIYRLRRASQTQRLILSLRV